MLARAVGIVGLQMQTLFRNPLADPFARGISAGASLGVALVVLGSGYGVAAAFGTAMGMRGDALITAAAIVGAALVLGLRRASCCRIYLLPRMELCASCPLVSQEERLARNRRG